jgi:phosphotransferase system HPr (HPr) family protein
MESVQLVIHNKVGLHARPAAVFVKTAGRFKCTISVCNLATNSKPANAKSILQVLSLGVQKNHCIAVTAEGADEALAVAALREAAAGRFGETE